MYSISNILSYIKTLFKKTNTKIQTAPAQVIAFTSNNRNGLSYRAIASDILTEFDKLGIETGLIRNGEENLAMQAEAVRVKVIVEHLIKNAKITCAIQNTAIQTTVTGVAGGIPVTGTGINLQAIKATGVIQ